MARGRPARGRPIVDLEDPETKALTLTVLKRIDPFIDEILITASHVSVYKFSRDSMQWSRKNVEGPLFVLKRNSQPRFQFFVLNRRNLVNLAEDIVGDFAYTVQAPYLLYRNAAQDINGIWFHTSSECDVVANLFNRIASLFPNVPQRPAVPSLFPNVPLRPAVPARERSETPDSVVTEGPLQSSASSAPPTPDAPTNPIFNHFSEGKQVPSVQVVAGQRQQTFQPPSLIDQSRSYAPQYPPGTLQHLQAGTPLLQPFPPSLPSPYLASSHSSGLVITREQIRNALMKLVQNDQVIEMVYQEILNSHGA